MNTQADNEALQPRNRQRRLASAAGTHACAPLRALERAMTCALCLRPEELQRSHVIPEFMFRALYDDKHRFHVISTDEAERNKYQQKGPREPLLCVACEQQFSRYERYASLALSGGIDLGYQFDGPAVVLSELEYKPFRLFQLSVLWRASVSRHEFFKDVSLGPHEESIRRALFDEDPGPSAKYGCVMCAIVHEGAIQQDVVLQPERVRFSGLKGYRFVFGGLVWVYVVSSHRSTAGIERGFLQEDGRAIVLMKQLGDFGDLIQMGGTLQAQDKLGEVRSNSSSSGREEA